MTWSIIARDERTGRIAIAVATRFFAAGALVTYIKTGAGAVVSQAFINPYFGSKGLALLDTGMSAEDVVAELIASDEGRHLSFPKIMSARSDDAIRARLV